MPNLPTAEILTAINQNQGYPITDEQLSRALATHQRIRANLDAIRAIQFSYIDSISPYHVLIWIESGGTMPIAR